MKNCQLIPAHTANVSRFSQILGIFTAKEIHEKYPLPEAFRTAPPRVP
jgi:hypothetical protein